MRILIVGFTTRGAAGHYVVGLVRSLRAIGLSVRLWVPAQPTLPSREIVAREVTELFEFSKCRNRAGLLIQSFMFGGMNHIAARLKKEPPEAIHFAFGEGYPAALRLSRAATGMGIHYGLTFHDPRPHGSSPIEQAHNRIARAVAKGAEVVHVHCDLMAKLVPGAKRIVVAAHPTFECAFCMESVPDWERKSGILFLGRFEPYKGLPVLVSALQQYYRLGGSLPAIIAGTGRVPADVVRLSKCDRRVQIRNAWLNDREIHNLLAAARIVVLPYITATQSGLPNQAAAHGCRVVATDVGCIGEATRQLLGLIVRPNATGELAEALLAANRPPPRDRDRPSFDYLAHRLAFAYGQTRQPTST